MSCRGLIFYCLILSNSITLTWVFCVIFSCYCCFYCSHTSTDLLTFADNFLLAVRNVQKAKQQQISNTHIKSIAHTATRDYHKQIPIGPQQHTHTHTPHYIQQPTEGRHLQDYDKKVLLCCYFFVAVVLFDLLHIYISITNIQPHKKKQRENPKSTIPTSIESYCSCMLVHWIHVICGENNLKWTENKCIQQNNRIMYVEIAR